jgi:predicted phage terminase large subunit-like protein
VLNAPDEVIREVLALEQARKMLSLRGKIQDSFMLFVEHVYDGFIEGSHHKQVATQFEKLAKDRGSRIIINLPPRHTKSEFASYLLPAWLIGKNPQLKIIQTTHTAELAVRFGRKVRNLMETDRYKEVFPDVDLRADSKAAGRWDHAYEWYTSGPRQRLQPGGSIVVVMTRWSLKDLTGKLIKSQASDVMADQWELVEFPAILPSGNILWPEFWNKDELLRVKASLSLSKWNAQWQQNPVAEEGAIIKKEWWNKWEKETIPPVSYIMQSYDTAFSKKETADYSAITTWGVFQPEEGGSDHLILMDAKRGRWDFPELKSQALREYEYWEPDMVLIEAKATGTPLTDELRTIGIPVVNYTPSKGKDKHTRMHMVAPIFESGKVWAPEKKFSEEVIDECAAFPNGDYDDYCDSMSMALIRYRKGGFLRLDSDEKDEEPTQKTQPRQFY